MAEVAFSFERKVEIPYLIVTCIRVRDLARIVLALYGILLVLQV